MPFNDEQKCNFKFSLSVFFMAHAFSLLRILDHRHNTLGRNPLGERPLPDNTTLISDRHPFIPVRFEPTISALERAATGIGCLTD